MTRSLSLLSPFNIQLAISECPVKGIWKLKNAERGKILDYSIQYYLVFICYDTLKSHKKNVQSRVKHKTKRSDMDWPPYNGVC